MRCWFIAASLVFNLNAPLLAAQPGTRGGEGFNDQPTAEQLAFFEKKIRPVLVNQCYSCHSSEQPDKLRGGLALDTREGLRRGGDSGPVVAPGQPDQSLLIKAIRYKDDDLRMPPKEPLPTGVIKDFEAWVRMGVPDPRTGEKHVYQQEIDIEKGRLFWAYQPPRAVPPPAVRDTAWPRTDVDRFLLAAMEARGLKPVADADPRTLVRRLHLDLIGLPPAADVTEQFLSTYEHDPQAALEELVDQLLASPHFGERWGRHWLDVARYAETTGKTVNQNYPHAWRYRDYVIAAFNADKPFDQFIREQIAGDLLPHDSPQDQAEKIIATGFLQIGSKDLNVRNRLQFELDVADEQIDTVTQAFLGQTAACARCHDHKFDPIPMRDYYALAGIFRSTENCFGTIRFVQAQQPSPLIKLSPSSAPTVIDPLTPEERQRIENTIRDLREQLRQQNDAIRGIIIFSNLALNQSRLDTYEPDGTPKVLAMGCRERTRKIDSALFIRGEPDKPGDAVPRGVLQVVGGPPVAIGKHESGRRQLADWIASPDNPLTARVYVNRVWRHLFGRGIVASPDNFGTTGEAPSNPALLDHLAIAFTQNGWSTKKLIRSLVLSHAYQLSTRYDPNNFLADPDNALVWRMTPSRLDAEVVRDSILAVSGRLDRTPPAGSPVARAGEGPSQRPGLGVRVDVNADRRCRSVYLPIIRDNLPEALALFDMADANMVIGDRPTTTVPAQALFLMNSPFVIDSAKAAAAQLLEAASSDQQRLRQAYLTFFGRPPTSQELADAERFIQRYPATNRRHTPQDAWTAFCQAMFGSAEFLLRN